MKLFNPRHKKINLATGLFLAFLIIFIFLSSYYKNLNDPDASFNRFLTLFKKNEKSVSSYLAKTRNLVEQQYNDTLSFYDIIPHDLYQSSGIIILVFKNDSLLFWSDNSAPFTSNDFTALQAPAVIELQDGYYYTDQLLSGPYQFVVLSLLAHQYAYENEFLKNTFHPQYMVPYGTCIHLAPSGYDIYSSGDQFLFSLKYPENTGITERQHMILFLFYLFLAVALIMLLFQLYEKISGFLKNRYLFCIAFSLDLIILRWFLYYFNIPRIFELSPFFGSSYYAYSDLFPSPGDLLLNLLVILAIASVFSLKFRPGRVLPRGNKTMVFIRGYFLMLIAFLLFIPVLKIIGSLVFDANFSLNLSDISLISEYSFIGLSAIFILLLSYVLIATRLFDFAYLASRRKFNTFIWQWLLAAITAIFVNFLWQLVDYIFVIFIAVFIISMYFFKVYQPRIFTFYSTIFYLFLFSVFSTYSLQTMITAREKEERKMIAMQLTRTYNPLVEYNFNVAMRDITRDLRLQGLLVLAFEDAVYEDSALHYLENQYLQHIFPGYERYSTVCFPGKVLSIQPEDFLTECNAYFKSLINNYGDSSLSSNLFRYNLNESNSYISHLSIPVSIAGEIISCDIYCELFSPFIRDEELGYPELLIDASFDHFPETGNYSYARYHEGQLVYKYGNYIYSIDLPASLRVYDAGFFAMKGFSHYILPVDQDSHLILSKKRLSVLDAIAPFSYLLLFYAIYTLLYLLFVVFPYEGYALDINFRSRLQVSVITIIVIIFIAVGFVSVRYIKNLNDDKNNAILREKTHSVLIELEHKLADESYLSAEIQPYLSGLLNKFSLVFFSDINLYDLSGNLLASSRPRIFEKGLISDRMNAMAYKMLARDRNLLFIHEEKIGTYQYLSAYIPFRNSQNMIVAYLNLPYFAKTTELRTEISSFLTTFLNIYILFIALSIFLTLLISRYTTRPLQIIKDKMRSLSLGRSNQKIDWASNDEIGKLIREYNRMIDELARSAELLAKSERESAWREMAKQVAHEIKNPLTPMKLSVQYLEKAWDEKSSDFGQRLKRFTKTIIEQIDTLSMIASEFSDFAKMPQARSRKAELIDIIRNAMDLFKDTENISFRLSYAEGKDHIVLVDQKQLLRVFNNLIQNSIEAIGPDRHGEVSISVEASDDEFFIRVADNGPGIPAEQKDKIFSPSFTTKSSGMGLGLAMARSIIINSGGEITFESDEGNGAVFLIRLPKIES